MLGSRFRTMALLVCGTWTVESSAQSPTISVHRAIPVGTMTHLGIQVPPNSVCSLSPTNVGTRNALALYANENGVMHLSVTPQLEETRELELNCTRQDGGPFVVSLVLTSSAALRDVAFDRSMSLPDVGVSQPALAPDASLVTPEQLKAVGYPPRPDPVRSPQLFKAWSDFVTKPTTRVTSKLIARHGEPHFSGHQVNDSHWVGVEHVIGMWDVTAAAWTVPELFPNLCPYPPYGDLSEIGFWTGMEGTLKDNPALAQAGVDTIVQCHYQGNYCDYIVRSTYPWVEYWPDDFYQIPINVSPGDYVESMVELTDASGNINCSGGYLTVYSYNLSAGVYFYWIGLPIPAGRVQPCGNMNMAALFMGETRTGYYPANYNAIEMSGLAWPGTDHWDNPLNATDSSDLSSIWYTMVDSSNNPMEAVIVDTPNTLQFYFAGPQCGGI